MMSAAMDQKKVVEELLERGHNNQQGRSAGL